MLFRNLEEFLVTRIWIVDFVNFYFKKFMWPSLIVCIDNALLAFSPLGFFVVIPISNIEKPEIFRH